MYFYPLDKSDEAECVIFLNVFLKKKTCCVDLEQKEGCVCDPPQQAEELRAEDAAESADYTQAVSLREP